MVLFCGTYANSANPDQTPHNVASDQGLHCLLTENITEIWIKMKNSICCFVKERIQSEHITWHKTVNNFVVLNTYYQELRCTVHSRETVRYILPLH